MRGLDKNGSEYKIWAKVYRIIWSNVMKKMFFGFGLSLAVMGVVCATPALANPTQIAIAKKAILAGEVMPYATPELRQLLKKAYQIDEKIQEQFDDPLGCEFYEHYYLGHGNKGLEGIKNWKATPLKGGIIRITFNNTENKPYDADLIEFVMKRQPN